MNPAFRQVLQKFTTLPQDHLVRQFTSPRGGIQSTSTRQNLIETILDILLTKQNVRYDTRFSRSKEYQ